MIQTLYIDLCTYLDGGGIGTGNKREPITFLTQWKLVGNSIIVEDGEVDNTMLPKGYQLCEYIESNGNQVIALGYNTKLTYDMLVSSTRKRVGTDVIIGNGGSITNFFAYYNGTLTLSWNTYAFDSPNDIQHAVVTFKNDLIEATVDGEYKSATGASNNGNYYLFGRQNAIDTLTAAIRLYKLQALDNGVLVHDWIPCLDANGVACLYDAIGNKTYYCSDVTGAEPFAYKLAESSKTIMSCSDLGEDGKYHVLIKADSEVIDIPLDKPLRKVGDVADTIEFPTDTANTARVTRNIGSVDMGSLGWRKRDEGYLYTIHFDPKKIISQILLCAKYQKGEPYASNKYDEYPDKTISASNYGETKYLYVKDTSCLDARAFAESNRGVELLFELADPTTSYISVSNIPLAKAYSSENRVPYSEFSYENPNALYIDGEPMVDDDGNEIVMKIGGKTFNID